MTHTGMEKPCMGHLCSLDRQRSVRAGMPGGVDDMQANMGILRVMQSGKGAMWYLKFALQVQIRLTSSFSLSRAS